jgi:glycosyltransferase involved in cell wall biosynthesis
MKVVYLTYDGILDPLGQSQILPYILGLREEVDSIRIVSFEKKSHTQEALKTAEIMLTNNTILWTRRQFTESSFSLMKIVDVCKFFLTFLWICIKEKPDLIHARGHPMAILASFFKYFFNFKLLFDYRGVWADERVAKGSWNLEKIFDRLTYNLFVLLEHHVLKKSEHVVALTNAVKNQIIKNTNKNEGTISVIPCACDYRLFKLKKFHKSHHTKPITIGYLGSIGPAYRFDFYLKILQSCLDSGIPIKGLVLTNNPNDALREINLLENPILVECLSVVQAPREEIPAYIHQMDILLSFYTSFKSIIGTSPVKIAEVIACGVPVIANKGIGDVDDVLADLGAGITINYSDEESINKATSYISECRSLNFDNIRENSKKYFDLNLANQIYKDAYKLLKTY